MTDPITLQADASFFASGETEPILSVSLQTEVSIEAEEEETMGAEVARKRAIACALIFLAKGIFDEAQGSIDFDALRLDRPEPRIQKEVQS